MKYFTTTTILAAVLALSLAVNVAGCSDASSTDAGKHFNNQEYAGSAKTWPAHQAMLDKPMPELRLSSWRGELSSLDQVKGKVVVLDFWATWCPPCLSAVPHNNQLHARLKKKGALLIGVCCGRDQHKMEAVAERLGVSYPLAKDVADRVFGDWQVSWVPTYAVVDGDGVLRAMGVKSGAIESVVDRILAQ